MGSADVGGRRREDFRRSYEKPLPDTGTITRRVASWDEQVGVYVDGERRQRPGGEISEALTTS